MEGLQFILRPVLFGAAVLLGLGVAGGPGALAAEKPAAKAAQPGSIAAAHGARHQAAAIPVDRSYVCFADDSYKGKRQIPVEVDGKTYYGCCPGCVERLRRYRSIRYATDPQTGAEVDKATAFVAFESPESKRVLYFESAESYRAYMQRKK